jgi:hypothetical protein
MIVWNDNEPLLGKIEILIHESGKVVGENDNELLLEQIEIFIHESGKIIK